MERQMLLLSVVSHEVDGNIIPQRVDDGYINATALCSASGKQVNDYFRLKNTQAFLNELSSETGIPVSELVITQKGGNTRTQGTWVHPDIAVNLGQWVSPRFAVFVSKWVRENSRRQSTLSPKEIYSQSCKYPSYSLFYSK